MKKFSLLIGILFLIPCGASVNPQLKAKNDNQFTVSNSTQFASTQKFMKPRPYAVGQYVILGQTDSDGKKCNPNGYCWQGARRLDNCIVLLNLDLMQSLC